MDEIIKGKISEFNRLMKELSKDFSLIFKEGKEDMYHDELILMLESLDSAQKTIRETFHLFLSRTIDDN